MLRSSAVACLLLVCVPGAIGQASQAPASQTVTHAAGADWKMSPDGHSLTRVIPVEVVASASEYVPSYTTVTQPGRALTNCTGHTDYFGSFHSYGDSGTVSGTAQTDTRCKTTFTPPTETTIATYRKWNYTIAKSPQALYLVACVQTWKPSPATRLRAAVVGAAGAAGNDGSGPAQEQAVMAQGSGHWSDCPAFAVGTAYSLVINNASDARLEGTVASKKPVKLEYLGSAELSAQGPPPAQSQGFTEASARVHITSAPDGGEIYIDGKFFGNTPSDITLPVGEHAVKVILSGKEWSRLIQISPGEISVHAEILPKAEQH